MQQCLAICGFSCSPFVLMILATENAALSACLKAAPPIPTSFPSMDARAARVRPLSRGFRRRSAPPPRTVPWIVPGSQPGDPGREAPVEGPRRWARRSCVARNVRSGIVKLFNSRPEIPPEAFEKVEFRARVFGAHRHRHALKHASRPTRCIDPRHEGGEVPPAASTGDKRPKTPAQGFEKVESAPGFSAPIDIVTRSSTPRDRRDASTLGMRAERFRPPPPQATSARKLPRKALKRLNPRPGFRRPSTSPRAQARLETRHDASTLRMRAERFRPPPPQATSARKIPCKTLKRLNPRPELGTSWPRGACFETRRFASPLSMRAGRDRPPPRQATKARKIRRKALKTLNPRPIERPSAQLSRTQSTPDWSRSGRRASSRWSDLSERRDPDQGGIRARYRRPPSSSICASMSAGSS